MNITLLQPSPISPSYPQLHHYYHPSSPFNFITTKTKTINSFVLNYSNTSSITTTSKTEPPDQKLLTLLQQRKTEEAWILYTHSTHIPNPTCLNRLLSQLSYLNTPSSLTRAQSILTRLRNESQLHRLDSNSLGLLAVAAAKAGHTLYASSIVKSMLRSGYLPHVKAWSAVVSCLTSDDDVSEPSEALSLFHSVTRRLKKLPDINLAADSVPDTVAFNAALNACAILGDGRICLCLCWRGFFS
ncbi:hypothetical protein P8452_02343 [Trifolium repens]|nr:hypothetical protein P8452_02343 [Trifolium repens]